MATQQIKPSWTAGSLSTLQARLSRIEDRMVHLQEQNFFANIGASTREATHALYVWEFGQAVISALKRRIEYEAAVEAGPWC